MRTLLVVDLPDECWDRISFYLAPNTLIYLLGVGNSGLAQRIRRSARSISLTWNKGGYLDTGIIFRTASTLKQLESVLVKSEYDFQEPIWPVELGCLPKSLTELSLNFNSSFDATLFHVGFCDLFPSLRILSLQTYFDPDIHLLNKPRIPLKNIPRSLTRLSLVSTRFCYKIKASHLADLPENLESLRLAVHCNPKKGVDLATYLCKFPLRYIEIKLPYRSLFMRDETACLTLARLHPALVHITVEGLTSNGFPDEDYKEGDDEDDDDEEEEEGDSWNGMRRSVAELRERLPSLKVWSIEPHRRASKHFPSRFPTELSSRLEVIGSDFDPSSLPNNVRSLDCEALRSSSSSKSPPTPSFPSSLKELKVRWELEEGLLAFLPPSLTSLHVPRLTNTSVLAPLLPLMPSTSSLDEDTAASASALVTRTRTTGARAEEVRLICPHLTRLSCSMATAFDFNFAPRTVQHLHIRFTSTIFLSHVLQGMRDLPLRSLTLKGCIVPIGHLTAALPRKLEELSVKSVRNDSNPSTSLSPEHINALPKSLRILRMRFNKKTELLQLDPLLADAFPKGLCSLRLKGISVYTAPTDRQVLRFVHALPPSLSVLDFTSYLRMPYFYRKPVFGGGARAPPTFLVKIWPALLAFIVLVFISTFVYKLSLYL